MTTTYSTKKNIFVKIFVFVAIILCYGWRIENNILIIEKGDNLSKISHSLFGQGTSYNLLWRRCIDSLKNTNPNLIYDGMRFNLDSLFNLTSSTKTPIIHNFPLVLENQKEIGIDGNTLIALLSALFSLLAVAVTIILNSKSVRNTARVEHNNFFQEIDKLLIADPTLWTVYDDPLLSGGLIKSNYPQSKMKRKAFLYLHLNSYDSIFYFYKKTIRKHFKVDKNTFESWTNYYEHLYQNSDEFRQIVENAIKKRFYQNDFTNHLKAQFKIP